MKPLNEQEKLRIRRYIEEIKKDSDPYFGAEYGNADPVYPDARLFLDFIHNLLVDEGIAK